MWSGYLRAYMISKIPTIVSLIGLLLSGCHNARSAEDQKKYFEGLVKEKYSSTARDSILAEAMTFASQNYRGVGRQWKFIYSFFDWYLHALEDTGGTVTIGNGNNPHQLGFDYGVDVYERRDVNGEQELSLEDFGYELLAAEGTYECDFEISDFRPKGDEGRWWVKFRDGVLNDYAHTHGLDEEVIFRSKRICKLQGYLAPADEGGVGHGNQYDRKLIVTEILRLD